MPSVEVEYRVLVLAPVGRDADCICSVITDKNLHVRPCRDLKELCDEIPNGAGCVLLVEEALAGDNLAAFRKCLDAQPAWSDVPVVLLTSSGQTSEGQLAVLNPLMLIGNVTLLERPLRAITLVTGIQAALRSRSRQYGVRTLLQEQTRARLEAERLNRLKDEFLSTLSHELRTPLTPLLGWTKMLLDSRLDEATRHKALLTMDRNVKTQIQLIDDLLDISRIINGKMRLQINLVDMNKILEAAAEVVRAAALAKGVELHISLPSTPLKVLGDFDRLQQVLWNLLTNAVKFTPPGGLVRASLHRTGSAVQCIVSDTGVGIHKEFLPRLFERFSQADSSISRKYGGLGIGLSLVQSLLELHGGSIIAHSAGEGMGATFTATLPVQGTFQKAEDAAPRLAAESIKARPARLDGVQVLVVEDHNETRELLSAILRSSGATVTAAASVKEGFDRFVAKKPDVILSDLGLPDEDGYELIRRIRNAENKNDSRTPAIALTAYATDADRARCLEAGFQKHLAKPVEPGGLVCALAELAGSDSSIRYNAPAPVTMTVFKSIRCRQLE